MNYANGQLRVLRVLLELTIYVLEFKFFNRLDHQKPPLSATMIAAPRLIVMPTQSLHDSVTKFFSRQLLGLRRSAGSRGAKGSGAVGRLVTLFGAVVEVVWGYDGNGLRLGRRLRVAAAHFKEAPPGSSTETRRQPSTRVNPGDRTRLLPRRRSSTRVNPGDRTRLLALVRSF
ncbi:hypothetical protein B296_00038189, partial [Ensete ventricosum]